MFKYAIFAVPVIWFASACGQILNAAVTESTANAVISLCFSLLFFLLAWRTAEDAYVDYRFAREIDAKIREIDEEIRKLEERK